MYGLYRKTVGFCLIGILISALCGPLAAHPEADKRLSHLNQKITANPNEQTLYLQRAWLLIMAKHYPQAHADLQQADKLGPAINSSYHKGLIHSQQQQYVQAISYFDQVLVQQPNDSTVLSARAQAHIGRNDLNAALNDYQQILHSTVAPQPSHYLDTAKLVYGISDYHGAIAIIDEGITTLGLNPQLQQYAVDLCIENADIQQALNRHQSLHAMMQNNASWYVQYADLLIINKQWQTAQKALQQAQYLLENSKSRPWVNRLKQTVTERLLALKN